MKYIIMFLIQNQDIMNINYFFEFVCIILDWPPESPDKQYDLNK